jgi:hypothetical protein
MSASSQMTTHHVAFKLLWIIWLGKRSWSAEEKKGLLTGSALRLPQEPWRLRQVESRGELVLFCAAQIPQTKAPFLEAPRTASVFTVGRSSMGIGQSLN